MPWLANCPITFIRVDTVSFIYASGKGYVNVWIRNCREFSAHKGRLLIVGIADSGKSCMVFSVWVNGFNGMCLASSQYDIYSVCNPFGQPMKVIVAVFYRINMSADSTVTRL